MWILYAFGSAIFAGITAILAKCGIKNTNSNVATAIRTGIILIFSWLIVYINRGDSGPPITDWATRRICVPVYIDVKCHTDYPPYNIHAIPPHHTVSAISATVYRVTGGPSASSAMAMTKRAAAEITTGSDLRSLVMVPSHEFNEWNLRNFYP